MARILVTGALGNVGREVASACVEAGLPVRVAGRDAASLRERFPGADAARLDFLDRSTWAPALAGCDRLFLMRPPQLSDMAATLNPFCDAAYAAGVRHLVFLSVAGADRNSWVPHRQVELHLAGTGDRWTVLRPGFFAQNLGDAYRRDLVEDDRLYVPAGRGRVAFVDVRDLAAFAVRVFQDPERFRGRSPTLTGGEAIDFDEVARILGAALGRPIRYRAASIPGYAWHLRRRRRMPWVQIAVQTILHVGLRRGDAEAVDPALGAVLGRRPRSLAEYVRDNAGVWAR